MTDKKDRERVIAEITLSHLIRLGTEQGYRLSRQQALAFLNQEGRAFEIWKHWCRRLRISLQAAGSSILSAPEDATDSRLGLAQSGPSAPSSASNIPCPPRRLQSTK